MTLYILTEYMSYLDRTIVPISLLGCSQSQLPAANVSSILLQLELLGFVTQLPGMRYQR